MKLESLWYQLYHVAELETNPSQLWRRLHVSYSAAERHYHTLAHVNDCLNEFQALKHLCPHPVAVELAIWFHDIIYDPRSSDNEEQSAALADTLLTKARCDIRRRETVKALILATKHPSVPQDMNQCVIIDSDLAILGQPARRFDEYERQIRQEYAWVPEEIYRRKRREFLTGLRRFVG